MAISAVRTWPLATPLAFLPKMSVPTKPQIWLLPLSFFILTFLLMHLPCGSLAVGVNWGVQASHPFPPSIMVKLLQANGIAKVKLFDTNSSVIDALVNSGLEVILGIPNDHLQSMNDEKQAAAWVQNNVVPYSSKNSIIIKYVAVGNEPFLKSYNGTYIDTTYPALVNIQKALNAANLGDQIKATVPMNADVISVSTLPSGSSFRSDILSIMTQIVIQLSQNSAPFTVNFYPFLDLYNDASFPVDYAFFDGAQTPVVDGAYTYQNVFDASYDALVAALATVGPYGNMSIIVGEIGWPTDGSINANIDNAKKFNQGFINHVQNNGGTPRRPNSPIEFYLFSIIDEDSKSIQPGNFERHWGIFQYDGKAKYALSLTGANGQNLVEASGVRHLTSQWCTYKPDSGDQSDLGDSITYACASSDCTSLGYGSSCNPYLDQDGNASYAFNAYFQRTDQAQNSCYFGGLGQVVSKDPSVESCQFIIQIAEGAASSGAHKRWRMSIPLMYAVGLLTPFFLYGYRA